jgi:hypothetical protein
MKIGDFLKTLSNGRADDAGGIEAALKRLEAEKTAAQAEMAAIAARRADLLIADDNAVPTLHNELLLGDDPEIRRHLVVLLSSLLPRAGELGLSRDKFGDLDTLPARLDAARREGLRRISSREEAGWNLSKPRSRSLAAGRQLPASRSQQPEREVRNNEPFCQWAD